jgi:hypothetical protein
MLTRAPRTSGGRGRRDVGLCGPADKADKAPCLTVAFWRYHGGSFAAGGEASVRVAVDPSTRASAHASATSNPSLQA